MWKPDLNRLITTIMAAAIGAMLTWVAKIDERVFALSATAATRSDFQRIEDRIDKKLDEVVKRINELRSIVDRNLGN